RIWSPARDCHTTKLRRQVRSSLRLGRRTVSVTVNGKRISPMAFDFAIPLGSLLRLKSAPSRSPVGLVHIYAMASREKSRCLSDSATCSRLPDKPLRLGCVQIIATLQETQILSM